MSRGLPRVTADAVLRALGRDGWFISRQSGSHVILRHPDKSVRVVVPRHGGGKTLRLGTLAAILESASLMADELRRLI
ncbi:MAG: type II toxin-antitoxin system HicA family toxin [Thermomicrobiales bacterium]